MVLIFGFPVMRLHFSYLTITTSEVIKVTLVSQQPKGIASRCLKSRLCDEKPCPQCRSTCPLCLLSGIGVVSQWVGLVGVR